MPKNSTILDPTVASAMKDKSITSLDQLYVKVSDVLDLATGPCSSLCLDSIDDIDILITNLLKIAIIKP